MPETVWFQESWTVEEKSSVIIKPRTWTDVAARS